MATIKFHRKFVVDLVDSGDAQLPNRVFKKLFTEEGEFRPDRDDHRYRGIDDAWIRVVSRGNSAYRVIYLRENDGITIYRAGPHSVEDNLAAPGRVEGFHIVSQEIMAEAFRPVGGNAISQEMARTRLSTEQVEASRFMKNHENRRLYEQVIGRRLIPHKEVILVSPFLSLDILKPTKILGQMLDEWICDNCSVTLITKPPNANELAAYSALESRGFSIIYVARLHAKAYVFRVDRGKLNEYQSAAADLVVMGSANLTNSGFNPDGIRTSEPQLELNYKIADEDQDEFENFLAYLAGAGVGHDVVRNNISSLGAR
ncbi:hypothetical protein [Acidovorax sp. SUPP2539]|uniref:hypothetical protein n=1 Tax=Acidovorax sp. SUPP2539 TaxID=2920878 RepID=UPI0023DE6772|nr:hypothetical protein [Acidovorax sp. SUPP2539]GKS89888.1 hypothetical protein AVTE2539_11005 [Acidovorax sp. SUPP2539]